MPSPELLSERITVLFHKQSSRHAFNRFHYVWDEVLWGTVYENMYMVFVCVEDGPLKDVGKHMEFVMLEDVKCPAEVWKLREMNMQSYISHQYYAAEYILQRIRKLKGLD